MSTDPPILYYTSDLREDVSPLLPDRPIYRLRWLSWSHSVEEIAEYHARAVRCRPQDLMFCCVNLKDMADKLTARGISVYFISNSCFIDEQIFRIMPETTKEFDAVYNARMAPFKRHALARRIHRPLLIGGTATGGDSVDYFAQVRAAGSRKRSSIVPRNDRERKPATRNLSASERMPCCCNLRAQHKPDSPAPTIRTS